MGSRRSKKGAKYSEIKGNKAFHPRGRATGGQEANQGRKWRTGGISRIHNKKACSRGEQAAEKGFDA